MNFCNDNQKQEYELIDTLASKEHTETETRIAKRFVEENWAKFPSDYENTSRNQRCSSGKVENELFNHIAGLCKWKTNKEYMKIANQIMILCGYNSYKKNKNRFKQKIENILKKERKRLQLIKRSNSEEKRTRVFSNKDGSDQYQQMMNQDDNNLSEDDTDENVVGRDDQFQNNQHPNINNENTSPQPTDNPSENNTDNEQIRVQENSVNNDEQMWETICPNNLDLSTLSNPFKDPAYQQNLSDSVNNSFNIQLLKV